MRRQPNTKKKHINIFSSAASMLLYFSFPFLTLAHSHFISTEHLLLLLWLLWVRLHCISIFNALFRMAVCCRLHKCTWFYIVNPQCFASLRFKRYFISQLLHYFIFLFYSSLARSLAIQCIHSIETLFLFCLIVCERIISENMPTTRNSMQC